LQHIQKVGFQPDIVELIEGLDETGTNVAPVHAQRYFQYLKAGPIIKLKQLRYETGDPTQIVCLPTDDPLLQR
jgi:hypothetical protein